MKMSLFLAVVITNGVYFFAGKYMLTEYHHFALTTQAVIEKTIPGLDLLHQLSANLAEIRRSQIKSVVFSEMSSDSRSRLKEKSLVARNEEMFIQYARLTESAEEKALLVSMEKRWRDYLTVSRRAIFFSEQGDKEKARQILLNDASGYFADFEKENERAVAVNNEYIMAFSQRVSERDTRALMLFYSLMVMTWCLQGVFIKNLSKQNKQKTEAIRSANTDPLTGLFNRRKILSEWEKYSAAGNTLVIIGDIDHFKQVNDTYGHDAGDFILVAVGRLLKQGCRETDLVARTGGEEFVIIAHKTTLDEAYMMAERIREAVALAGFTYRPDKVIRITISFGLSQCPDRESSFEHALSLADRKLYQSKNEGRNRTSC